jgi:hypothetical protein
LDGYILEYDRLGEHKFEEHMFEGHKSAEHKSEERRSEEHKLEPESGQELGRELGLHMLW